MRNALQSFFARHGVTLLLLCTVGLMVMLSVYIHEANALVDAVNYQGTKIGQLQTAVSTLSTSQPTATVTFTPTVTARPTLTTQQKIDVFCSIEPVADRGGKIFVSEVKVDDTVYECSLGDEVPEYVDVTELNVLYSTSLCDTPEIISYQYSRTLIVRCGFVREPDQFEHQIDHPVNGCRYLYMSTLSSAGFTGRARIPGNPSKYFTAWFPNASPFEKRTGHYAAFDGKVYMVENAVPVYEIYCPTDTPTPSPTP